MGLKYYVCNPAKFETLKFYRGIKSTYAANAAPVLGFRAVKCARFEVRRAIHNN